MKNNEKLISVLMSCHNSEKTIEKSVNSILDQTYSNFEFLINDDFSSDRTFKIINDYRKKDERIKIFKNPSNIGLTKSLNILIKQAKGKYIARQDADDRSFEDRLNKQLNILENTDYKICTTRALIKNSKRKIPKFSIYIPKKIITRYKNPFIHGTLMIEKELLDKTGGYDDNFYYAQDYKLFWDLLNMGNKIKTLHDVLYELNMVNNISSTKTIEQRYYADCVKNKITPNTEIKNLNL